MRIVYLRIREEDFDLEKELKQRGLLPTGTKSSSLKLKVDGIFKKDILRVYFPKQFGTEFLKFTVPKWTDALRPRIDAIAVGENDFTYDFLRKQVARSDSWTMRFWELGPVFSRSVAAWKEEPEVWAPIQSTLRGAGRGTTWAGVEFTHDRSGVRVAVYRYPTAALWGIGSSERNPHLKTIQGEFEKFLR